MKLERIYIDNYKCLVNFELKLHDTVTLLMGPNGGGKSVVFEALRAVRAYVVDEAPVEQIFVDAVFSKFSRPFPLTIRLEGVVEFIGVDALTYELQVHRVGGVAEVVREAVSVNQRLAVQWSDGRLTQHTKDGDETSSVSVAARRSVLGLLGAETNISFPAIQFFEQWLADLQIARPLAPAISAVSDSETASRLTFDASNFASWYRHMSLEHQGVVPELLESLQEVIAGFATCRLVKAGRNRILQVQYEGATYPVDIDFDAVSDGERQLVVLYALLKFTAATRGVLWLDEPGNFLALPQLQPWIIELRDVCVERGLQAVLISHHPEIIDYLAPDAGLWLEREPGGPTKPPQPVEPGDEADGGLKLSELIARRWVP